MTRLPALSVEDPRLCCTVALSAPLSGPVRCSSREIRMVHKIVRFGLPSL